MWAKSITGRLQFLAKEGDLKWILEELEGVLFHYRDKQGCGPLPGTPDWVSSPLTSARSGGREEACLANESEREQQTGCGLAPVEVDFNGICPLQLTNI